MLWLKPEVSLWSALRTSTIGRMSSKPPLGPEYRAVLAELVAMQETLRRLEVRVLQLLDQVGIADEDIGAELGISSQAVGKRRRRQI